MGVRRTGPLVVVLVTTRHHLDALIAKHEDALFEVRRAAGLIDEAIIRSICAPDLLAHTATIKELSAEAWALHTEISRVISILDEVTPDD
jgi:hypothetical protein